MNDQIPTREELKVFLVRQLDDARRHGSPERVDHLLDQLNDLDGTIAFLGTVLDEES